MLAAKPVLLVGCCTGLPRLGFLPCGKASGTSADLFLQWSALQIREVRLRGGDVIVSFGGAAGQELAQVVSDEDALVSWHQAPLNLQTDGGRMGGQLGGCEPLGRKQWRAGAGCSWTFGVAGEGARGEARHPSQPRPPPCLDRFSLPPCPQLGMYQSVIDQYRLRWIDFDIEGQAVAQPVSVDRRNRVLARLQVRGAGHAGPAKPAPCQPPPMPHAWKFQSSHGLTRIPNPQCAERAVLPLPVPLPPQAANPGLTLSYTLPVLPDGLTADGVRLLESAAKAGVRVDVLNIMTMDYGDSAAPGTLWAGLELAGGLQGLAGSLQAGEEGGRREAGRLPHGCGGRAAPAPLPPDAPLAMHSPS